MNKQSNDLMREYHKSVRPLLMMIRHSPSCVGVL